MWLTTKRTCYLQNCYRFLTNKPRNSYSLSGKFHQKEKTNCMVSLQLYVLLYQGYSQQERTFGFHNASVRMESFVSNSTMGRIFLQTRFWLQTFQLCPYPVDLVPGVIRAVPFTMLPLALYLHRSIPGNYSYTKMSRNNPTVHRGDSEPAKYILLTLNRCIPVQLAKIPASCFPLLGRPAPRLILECTFFIHKRLTVLYFHDKKKMPEATPRPSSSRKAVNRVGYSQWKGTVVLTGCR